MSKNIVFEGWLTKSPPTKGLWRAKWRRRWFALRQSGELPGQYFLDYYRNRNCTQLKGTIDLDLCEQVDAGLHMERGNSSLDPKIRGSVFTIRTQFRTYHLEAECEADMAKWVDAICRVCGLRATDDNEEGIGTYQSSAPPVTVRDQFDSDRDVYIPISECTTGVRVQDTQRAFTFDPKNIVTSTFKNPNKNLKNVKTNLSESESNMSDEDCHPSNIGPPVPPRPPKLFQGPKMQEPNETIILDTITRQSGGIDVPRQMTHRSSQTSPGRLAPLLLRYIDDEDESACAQACQSQYINLYSLPPAVDRALKPRHSGHNIAHIHLYGQHSSHGHSEKGDTLQYLDLDFPLSNPNSSKLTDASEGKVDSGKRKYPSGEKSEYKTVDFVKTEAFNITRQDAEASRLFQQ